MLTDAFKKEMDKFDRDRVIPAWDRLVSRQQMELAHSHVPTMFVTNQAEDRQVRLTHCQAHRVSQAYYAATAASC